MLLDESSVVNLELFDNQSGQRQHTLYAVVNRTLTPMGGRLLRQWLRQPLLDLDQVNQRLHFLGSTFFYAMTKRWV